MIAETKDFIERFKGTYSKTLQVQSRVKMLEKLELIEVDEEDTSALRLKFPPSPRSGSYPVIAQELSKYYGDHLVFKEAGFTIQREEKGGFRRTQRGRKIYARKMYYGGDYGLYR